jgi:hypothetical protein
MRHQIHVHTVVVHATIVKFASMRLSLLAGTKPVWNETLRFNGADYANEAIITVSSSSSTESDTSCTKCNELQDKLQEAAAAALTATQAAPSAINPVMHAFVKQLLAMAQPWHALFHAGDAMLIANNNSSNSSSSSSKVEHARAAVCGCGDNVCNECALLQQPVS